MENYFGYTETEQSPNHLSYGTAMLILRASSVIMDESPNRFCLETPELFSEIAKSNAEPTAEAQGAFIKVYRRPAAKSSEDNPTTHIDYSIPGGYLSSMHVMLRVSESGLPEAKFVSYDFRRSNQIRELEEDDGQALLHDLATLADRQDLLPTPGSVAIRLAANDLN